jgi:hypothetical protein
MLRVVVCALAVVLAPSAGAAEVGKWAPWTFERQTSLAATGYKHDDGGALVIACDQPKRMMLLFWLEPRAKWHQGDLMRVTIRTDVAGELVVDGQVIGSTTAGVKNDATLGLVMMSKAKDLFVLGNGEYARVFPAAGFEASVAVPLRACGDHW